MKGTAKSLQDLLAADDDEFLAKAKAMAEASPEELGFKADGLAAEIEADITHEVANTLGEKSVKNSFGDNDCKAKSAETCRCDGKKIVTVFGEEIDLNKLNFFSEEEIDRKIQSKPERISLKDALEILHKKQEINITPQNSTIPVSFKASKLIGEESHLQGDHSDSDFNRRMRHLLFAIDTVRTGSVHAEGSKRFNYIKTYSNDHLKIKVVADEKGDVREVFTYFSEKNARRENSACKNE